MRFSPDIGRSDANRRRVGERQRIRQKEVEHISNREARRAVQAYRQRCLENLQELYDSLLKGNNLEESFKKAREEMENISADIVPGMGEAIHQAFEDSAFLFEEELLPIIGVQPPSHSQGRPVTPPTPPRGINPSAQQPAAQQVQLSAAQQLQQPAAQQLQQPAAQPPIRRSRRPRKPRSTRLKMLFDSNENYIARVGVPQTRLRQLPNHPYAQGQRP